MADGYIPTGSSEYLYKQVVKTLKPKGIELDSWYRFFLVPGMGHCAGTSASVNAPWYFGGGGQASSLSTNAASPVPELNDPQHNILLALMAWTENGTAPDAIVATKWENDTLHDKVLRQRPLCPYPQHAQYCGHGNPDDAASWKCVSPYAVV